jgi:glycosyltransferase involved in cell wall biosynthesis
MTQISVALPVYNGANFLREALESILSQDFADFELVISDNCSTDETPQILAEFVNRDPRVRVHRSEKFLPQAENVNRAVELCSSTWVKLFCHDDLMLPGCLREIRQAITNNPDCNVRLVGNGEGWLFGNGYLYTTPSVDFQSRVFAGPEFVEKMLGGKANVGLPSLTTATVNKEAWEGSGKFDRRFAHFDVFLWLRLLMNWNYLLVPQVLTTNRIHGAQIAVTARRSLKSINDHRLFWREFLHEFGAELRLPQAVRTRTKFKGLAVAGTTVAIELLRKDTASALRVAAQIPAHWLPVLPLFVARSLMNERRRIATLKDHVPVPLIYPK